MTEDPADQLAGRTTPHDAGMLRAMALGFGVGSTLFAAGTVFVWLQLPELLANVTYALGAVCFTVAAAVQWRASVVHHPQFETLRSRAESDMRNADWTSAVAQLVGTLFFNIMTVRAVSLSLGGHASLGGTTLDYVDVWIPDVYGSTMFLISSIIALHPVSRRRRHALLQGRSWWICWANMAGSVLFAISAWGAQMLPSGQLQSVMWNNVGTFLGALGFLLASVLLWPGRASPPIVAPRRSQA